MWFFILRNCHRRCTFNRHVEELKLRDEATVCVVDDNPAVLQALTALVKVVFPNVKAFSSAAEFLAIYREHQPGCLVLDVEMPEMNGIELFQKLRQDKVALPVVFVTAHATVPTAVKAMQLGAIDFLEKPVQGQTLWGSIRRALDAGEQNRRRLACRHQAEERIRRLACGEREVLHRILEGKMNQEIAIELGLSTRTIEDRRARVMQKMEVESLVELVQVVMTH